MYKKNYLKNSKSKNTYRKMKIYQEKIYKKKQNDIKVRKESSKNIEDFLSHQKTDTNEKIYQIILNGINQDDLILDLNNSYITFETEKDYTNFLKYGSISIN